MNDLKISECYPAYVAISKRRTVYTGLWSEINSFTIVIKNVPAMEI